MELLESNYLSTGFLRSKADLGDQSHMLVLWLWIVSFLAAHLTPDLLLS